MAKKKRLNNALNEMEKEFIEEKMKRSGNNAQQMMESVGYTRQLKTLCYKIDIKCKNKKQKEFLQNLKDLKLKLNICDAPAGVGKSLLAITAALHLLKNGDVSKVIIIVPTVEASEATKIGLLPGDIEEKTRPYQLATRSTIEKILMLSGNVGYKEEAAMLMNSGLVEFELLSYARGRTFDDAFIILDEAENLSKREALLLIGRMGEGNTKIAMLGDHVQCDRKDLKSYNDCGLVHAKECLKGLSEVSVDEFDNSDIVRNSFITKVFDNW